MGSNTSTLLGLILAIVIVAGLLLSLSVIQEQNKALDIANFDECAAAGYPIMESYPEQCRTPDGRLFVRDISNDPYPQEGPTTSGGCAVAGCSSQLCVE